MASHQKLISGIVLLGLSFLSYSQCATSGTISTNCTHTGNWTLTNNVTINSGVTVTVNNGNVNTGTDSLIVYGNVDVNRTGCTGFGCLGVGSLTVANGGTLYIPSGSSATIAVENTFVVNGTMKVDGDLGVTGNMRVGGFGQTGDLVISGNLNAPGSTLSIYDDSYVSIQTSGTATFNTVTGGWNCCGGGVQSDAAIYVDGVLNADVDLESDNSTITGTGTVNGTIDDSGAPAGSANNDFDDCMGGSCECTTCDIPFPVELISFLGEASAEGVSLLWATATETNNEGFYVQRSFDGIDFEEIGFVGGQGNSSRHISYSYLDQVSTTNSYYRLKQVDFDGEFEFSPTIYVVLNSINDLQVFPNPIRDQIHITGHYGELYHVKLLNLNGKELINSDHTDLFSIERSITRELVHMTPGIYILKISSPESMRTIKLYID